MLESIDANGIEEFYALCTANGAMIIRPLTATAWGKKDFSIEDPDGYIVCFEGARLLLGPPEILSR